MPNLNALDDYLRSDASHPNSLGISDLDGFLTGIACGPESIPAKEWLDFALGDADETPGTILRDVRVLFQDIKLLLETGHPIEPAFWELQDGSVIAMDWCEGFMEAVKMRPERWDVFIQTDTGSKLMLPILLHMIDDQGNSEIGIPQEELDTTLDTAAEALPTVVPAIYRHIRMVTRN